MRLWPHFKLIPLNHLSCASCTSAGSILQNQRFHFQIMLFWLMLDMDFYYFQFLFSLFVWSHDCFLIHITCVPHFEREPCSECQIDFVLLSVEGMKVVCHELTQVTNDPEASLMDEQMKDTDRLASCLANKAIKLHSFIMLWLLISSSIEFLMHRNK